MKRSAINMYIRDAIAAIKKHQIHLPSFAYWTPEMWESAGSEVERIRTNGLGWDVTDFGKGDYDKLGGVLFTLRNGNSAEPEKGTPYAEKLIILKPGQSMPMHFHWQKTEDIINRGGGVIVFELYLADSNNQLDHESPVIVFCDGCERKYLPGEIIKLQPGESITITPKLYHKFWADEDDGLLICGEVSTVNNDYIDNYFEEPIARFSSMEEDEPKLYMLCVDLVPGK